MTGRELLKRLALLTDEQLDDFDLSVLHDGEYYSVVNLVTETETDVLDAGSPVLVVE